MLTKIFQLFLLKNKNTLEKKLSVNSTNNISDYMFFLLK